MPVDISTLAIKVDAHEAKLAALELGKLEKSSEKAEKATDKLRKENKKTEDSFQSMKRSIGGLVTVLGAGALVGAITNVSKASIKLASDLQETQGKFDVVFKGMTTQAESWSKTLQDSYIMAEEESKRYLSSLQDLLVPTGMARKEAGAMSYEFVKLAGDLASFNNLNTADVIHDIQSALQGSSETMAKYGVNVKQTKIEQEVFALGLAKTKQEITDADKAQALLSITLRQSADAIGDVARTSGSYANQMRLWEKNVTDIKTAYGTALLPVMNDLLADMNEWVKANDELLKQDVEAWARGIGTGVKSTATAIIKFKDVVDSISALGGPSYGEWGIIGFALLRGGPQAAALTAALITINDQLKNYNLNLGSLITSSQGFGEAVNNMMDVVKGDRDWNTGEWKGQIEERKTALADLTKSYGDVAKAQATQKDQKVTVNVKTNGAKKALKDLQAIKRAQGSLRDLKIDLMPEGLEKELASSIEEERQLEERIKELGIKAGATKAQMDDLSASIDQTFSERRTGLELDSLMSNDAEGIFALTPDDHTEELVRQQQEMSEAVRKYKLGDKEYAIQQLNEEAAKRQEMVDRGIASQQQLSEWYQAELANINETNNTTLDGMSSYWESTTGDIQSQFASVFVSGMKGQFGEIDTSFSSILDNMLNNFLNMIGNMMAQDLMGAIGLGGSSGGGGGSGIDWGGVVGGIGSFVGSLFHDGGRIKGFATGGRLTGGSGIRDDLFLGSIGNTTFMAQGGEYVVNPQATAANLSTLESINDGTFQGDSAVMVASNQLNGSAITYLASIDRTLKKIAGSGSAGGYSGATGSTGQVSYGSGASGPNRDGATTNASSSMRYAIPAAYAAYKIYQNQQKDEGGIKAPPGGLSIVKKLYSKLFGGGSEAAGSNISGVTSGGAAESLENAALYLQAIEKSISSGIGSASSWYSGLQAAQMGVNPGTQLALIEGSYGTGVGGGATTVAAGTGTAATAGYTGMTGAEVTGALAGPGTTAGETVAGLGAGSSSGATGGAGMGASLGAGAGIAGFAWIGYNLLKGAFEGHQLKSPGAITDRLDQRRKFDANRGEYSLDIDTWYSEMKDTLHKMQGGLGDTWDAMVKEITPVTDSVDTFVDKMVGFDVSMQDSQRIMELGIDGQAGTISRFLQDMGAGTTEAAAAAVGLVDALDSATERERALAEVFKTNLRGGMAGQNAIMYGGEEAINERNGKQDSENTYPGFAGGGYVKDKTLAWIAEKEPEYVIPQSKVNAFKDGATRVQQTTKQYNITVPVTIAANNPQDYNRSRSQIMADLANAVQAGVRNM